MTDTIDRFNRRLSAMIDDVDGVSRQLFFQKKVIDDSCDDHGWMMAGNDGIIDCKDNDGGSLSNTAGIAGSIRMSREEINEDKKEESLQNDTVRSNNNEEFQKSEDKDDRQDDDLLSQYFGFGKSKNATDANQSQYMIIAEDKSCQDYLRDDLSHISMKADQCSFYSIKSSTWQPSLTSKPQARTNNEYDKENSNAEVNRISSKKSRSQTVVSHQTNRSDVLKERLNIQESIDQCEHIYQAEIEESYDSQVIKELSSNPTSENQHKTEISLDFGSKAELLSTSLGSIISTIRSVNLHFSLSKVIDRLMSNLGASSTEKKLYTLLHDNAGLITVSRQSVQRYLAEVVARRHDSLLDLVSPLTSGSLESQSFSSSVLSLRANNLPRKGRPALPCEIVSVLILSVAECYETRNLTDRLAHHMAMLLRSAKFNEEAEILSEKTMKIQNVKNTKNEALIKQPKILESGCRNEVPTIDGHRVEIRTALVAYLRFSVLRTSSGVMSFCMPTARLPVVVESILVDASRNLKHTSTCNFKLVAMVAAKLIEESKGIENKNSVCKIVDSDSVRKIEVVVREAIQYSKDLLDKFESTSKHINASLFAIIFLSCCRILSNDRSITYETIITNAFKILTESKAATKSQQARQDVKISKGIHIILQSDTTSLFNDLYSLFHSSN